MSSVSSIGSNADLYGLQSQAQCEQSSRGHSAAKIASQLDTNGDGVIDKAEFSSALANYAQSSGQNAVDSNALFSKIDTNKDGKLSPQELAQARTQGHHHHHHHAEQGGGDNSAGSIQNKSGTALNAFIAQILQTYQTNAADPSTAGTDTGSTISLTA